MEPNNEYESLHRNLSQSLLSTPLVASPAEKPANIQGAALGPKAAAQKIVIIRVSETASVAHSCRSATSLIMTAIAPNSGLQNHQVF